MHDLAKLYLIERDARDEEAAERTRYRTGPRPLDASQKLARREGSHREAHRGRHDRRRRGCKLACESK